MYLPVDGNCPPKATPSRDPEDDVASTILVSYAEVLFSAPNVALGHNVFEVRLIPASTCHATTPTKAPIQPVNVPLLQLAFIERRIMFFVPTLSSSSESTLSSLLNQPAGFLSTIWFNGPQSVPPKSAHCRPFELRSSRS